MTTLGRREPVHYTALCPTCGMDAEFTAKAAVSPTLYQQDVITTTIACDWCDR